MQVSNVKTSKPWQKRLRGGWSLSSCEVTRSSNDCCVCSLIRMRGFVFDACIYLAVFTDNICASSVINLAHTATQRTKWSIHSSDTDLPGNPTKPPLFHAGLRKKCIAFPCNFLITVQSFHCGRSIDQFRLSPGRSSPYLSRGTESLSWHSRLALNLQFSHMRLKTENSSQRSSFSEWHLNHCFHTGVCDVYRLP